MSNAIEVDAPTLDDTLNERHRKKSDIARNGSDVTFPMAARCIVSRPNAATEGDQLALTVARSIRTWKYRAPGRETGWTPEEVQLSKALQPEPFGFESFPDRRLKRADVAAGRDPGQLIYPKSDDAQRGIGLDAQLPLRRVGKHQGTSSVMQAGVVARPVVSPHLDL